ncbi:MFS transporter [Chthonobacter rhizosphaerae]|uniref:MFS transporter n=1 Tax=Chthonobacter rhizosphaerae TaxID=2735553 RepID=UPI0015EEF0CF|nr:MFS transporter [Chthonobacter rhizosphaerae]
MTDPEPEGGHRPLAAESIPADDASRPAAVAGGDRIRAGTPAFRRASWGLFSAGFATFALLYSVQPLLPQFSLTFGVSPAESSLALSLTTGVLAVAMLVASTVSEVVGRKRVMLTALTLSALATLAVAVAPAWSQILGLRALTGLALSGLPAVAMAYLVDEMEKDAVGRAMGLYIGGSAFGGMSGRLIVGVLGEAFGWRPALGLMGAIGLAAALVFWLSLPAARNFKPARPDLGALTRSLFRHLKDPGLCLLFLQGFLLMGGFVALYNYLGYHLLEPPYGLNQAEISLIFLCYLLGTAASAWMGSLSDRLGRRRVLWAAILVMLAGVLTTLAEPLAIVVAGIAIATFGFFGAHSVVSAWVGLRAETAKAQASSLYLLAYYLGSSVAGTLGGVAWAWGGWSAVVGGVAGLTVAGLVVALVLSRMPPPKWMRVKGRA